MDKKKYQKIVDKHKATESRGLNLLIAFVVGGIVGALGQFLIEFYSYYLNISTKDASVFMIVTLIFFATLFTALGFFDKWVTFAKCGLIIPITGFAHSMASAGIEYKKMVLYMDLVLTYLNYRVQLYYMVLFLLGHLDL